ncbi:hypothetical protein KAJ27_16885, partial [bacterium]|nr:hypothetical protein [bacterium]
KVLEDTDASEFQVRILSDFQKNNSDEMNKILKVFEKNRRVSKIKLIKLTGSIPTLPNVFIENAKIKGEDVRPIFRDREYELDILINNRCEKDFRSLPISIDINGKSSTLKIDLPKFSTRLFTKKIRFDLEGYYKIAVKVMIPEKFQHFNRIQEDDVFRKVLSVKPKIYALLVTGSDYEAAYRQESFYLNLALNPYTSNSIGGNTGDIITARTYFRRFSGLDLKNFDIIYFLNVPFFTLDEQKKIVEYLKSGKCIVMIPGEKSDKDNYNKLPFMPGKITRMILDPGTEGVKFNIHINDIKNRLFRLFPQDRIKTYFSELFYYRCIKFAIDFDKQAATETIMNFESSLPFMIDYSPAEYNRGRVVVFTSQMLLDWSPNFPVSNTFAPFFHYFTVLYSNRLDDEICKRKINMKYSSDFHNNKSNEKTIVNLVYPDKTKKELPIKVAKNGISYFETDKLSIPGFYSIIKIEDKTIETSYFSTNPDYVIESITDYSEPSIKKLDRKTKFMPTTGSEVEMKNKDLTQIFIFILALIFIFEFFLTANSYRNA